MNKSQFYSNSGITTGSRNFDNQKLLYPMAGPSETSFNIYSTGGGQLENPVSQNAIHMRSKSERKLEKDVSGLPISQNQPNSLNINNNKMFEIQTL